jgi:hypothetical protein
MKRTREGRPAPAAQILIGPGMKDVETLSKRDREHAGLEALWEAEAIVELLDRLLDGGAQNDLDFQVQEKVGHAIRAVRRRLEDSVNHFAKSW